MVANPEIAFSVFCGSSYCQQPLFFSINNSLPSCWHSSVPGIVSPLFLYLGGILSLLFHQVSMFSKNSLHDYEENESSHLCCTLIVRKNLTAVSKGCDS